MAIDDKGGIDYSWDTIGSENSVWFEFNGGNQLKKVDVEGQTVALLDNAKDPSAEFIAFYQSIDHTLNGNHVTLKGKIKTEGVILHAGIWLRIDGASEVLAFDNMGNRPITGNTEWQEVSVVLPLSLKDRKIFFGGIVSGPGKAWFDDFKLEVDGKPLTNRHFLKISKLPAETKRPFQNPNDPILQLTTVTELQVQSLVLLARTWGFVKYHHMQVAAGQINMDAELNAILPLVLNAASPKEVQSVIVDWLDTLGEITPCAESCYSDNAFLSQPSLSWVLNEQYLGAELSNKLRDIYKNRGFKENYYLSSVGERLLPANESQYALASVQDARFRLLTLFRFWNAVKYYSPYNELLSQLWEQKLQQLIPVLLAADTETGFYMATKQMLAANEDSHTALIDNGSPATNKALFGEFTLPLFVKHIDGQWAVTAVIDGSSEIVIGDVIASINGKDLNEKAAELMPYVSASNDAVKYRQIAPLLNRTFSREAEIKLADGREESVTALTFEDRQGFAERIDTFDAHPMKMQAADGIGYINLAKVNGDNHFQVMQWAKKQKGLILDLRNYPEFMPATLLNEFSRSTLDFAQFKKPDWTTPGRFIPSQQSYGTFKPIYNPNALDKHLVVLVNEDTQSRAEFTAMAFRRLPNALILGSQTAGTDGDVAPLALPYPGWSTWITGLEVTGPAGAQVQKLGIIADIPVEQTVSDLKQGKDTQLEQAIKWIQSPEFEQKTPSKIQI
ncbi:S41 family peptidase [Motilimonas pumila]|uniref:Tail specific protease domain-containing protein n=1 Tax=Motilimonas pumila TaxID=2303987 RepID=A0A418YEE6_9GAMM|nr:S41 family peptidase [Motilimonas pumila]RJG47497.1 hypothetical protein D1Z90_11345 [Motilimonas pumila]